MPLGRLSYVSIRRWLKRVGPIHHPPQKGDVPYAKLNPSLRPPLLLSAVIPTHLTGNSTASNFTISKRLEPKTLFSDDSGCFLLKGSLGKPSMGMASSALEGSPRWKGCLQTLYSNSVKVEKLLKYVGWVENLSSPPTSNFQLIHSPNRNLTPAAHISLW